MRGVVSFRIFQRMRRSGQREMALIHLDIAVQEGYPDALYVQRQIKTRI
jgi:hypothetical protein